MTELPEKSHWTPNDTCVIFGEVFQRGYVNGLIDEAQQHNLNVIYSTVGRRDSNNELRPLTHEELNEKQQPLINIPLEAGFDMSPDSQGGTPCQQLQGVKMKEWASAKLNWERVKESREAGYQSFVKRTQMWVAELRKKIDLSKNLLIAHTMAGGIPRAKIMMPTMNRLFKGTGDRFASSEEFWNSDLGKLCDQSFMDVSAETFAILLEETKDLRSEIESNGGNVSYVAYGYHGTEVLIDGTYQWQSFSPYLQGFAKMQLENRASDAWKQKIKATVYNAPEILTNSSGVFLGIEVPLYLLISALKKEGSNSPKVQNLLSEVQGYFNNTSAFEEIDNYWSEFFSSDVIQQWTQFEKWPQHNGPDQMQIIKQASADLFKLQKDTKNPVTGLLSEIIFQSVGKIMFHESFAPRMPVWWVGHQAIAKQVALNS